MQTSEEQEIYELDEFDEELERALEQEEQEDVDSGLCEEVPLREQHAACFVVLKASEAGNMGL